METRDKSVQDAPLATNRFAANQETTQSTSKAVRSLTLYQIAELVDGELFGNPDRIISGCGTLKGSIPEEIAFLTSARLNDELAVSNAAAVIVPKGYQPQKTIDYIQVGDPEQAFCLIAKQFRPPLSRPRIGTSAKAFVSATARIGENVSIYPGAFIGDDVEIGNGSTIFPNVCILERCRIGTNVRIYPNATLYEDTVVKDHTTIHAGVVLGCHGFGYDSDSNGHQLRSQLGYVEIGEDVQLGANSCVDRGAFGATRVSTGTRFDNMVQIGHNCQIGEHNMICAHVGIAGSCQTGQFVVMGGQVGIGDHVDIGDRVRLGAKSGVMADIEAGQTMIGSPALPARKTMQVWAVQARLPELRSSINELNRKLDTIETDIRKRNDEIAEKLASLQQDAA